MTTIIFNPIVPFLFRIWILVVIHLLVVWVRRKVLPILRRMRESLVCWWHRPNRTGLEY